MRTSRIDRDLCYMWMAQIVSARSSCSRRAVGTVIVDSEGHICSTGYNGVPSGFPHCTSTPCAGAHLPSGTGLDACLSVHSEANGLLHCNRDAVAPLTMYITTTPCMSCAKLILNFPVKIKKIVAASLYSQPEVMEFLRLGGIEVNVIDVPVLAEVARFL